MTERMRYECIDPALGDQLWRLDDPDTPASLRQRLEWHCEDCAACGLERELAGELASGVPAGRLSLGEASGPAADALRRRRSDRRPAGWLAGGGALALAASLAVLLLLPPPPPDRLERSDDPAPAIERPRPDEVVLGGRPTIAWTAMPGARAYDVTVAAVGGDALWSERTEATSVTVPPAAALPVGQRYRAVVTPVPPYAGPAGGLRESFATGGAEEFVRYRAAAGSPLARWFAMVSLLAVLVGTGWLVVLRRR